MAQAHSPKRPPAEEGYGPERVPWPTLRESWLETFRQGDHTTILGPTGSGKTFLAFDVLEGLSDAGHSVLVLANKPADAGLTKQLARGYTRIRSWPPTYEQRHPHGPRRGGARVLFWPAYGKASGAKRNRSVFIDALDGALSEGGWVVYIDEGRYFVEQLGLRTLLDEYWNSARSSAVTLICGSQGPTWIPKAMVTQQTWLFSFRPSHLEESKEVAMVGGDREIATDLEGLSPRKHEFLLVQTRTHRRAISSVR